MRVRNYVDSEGRERERERERERGGGREGGCVYCLT